MFGRLVSVDIRDNDYRVKLSKKVSKRTSRYWNDSAWFGNQQSTPHCVGFSWAHWLANYPYKQYVDPDGIYTIAQYFDEWSGQNYDGTSVRAGAKVLQMLGFIKEYRWASNIDELIELILEVGPVVVGTVWYKSMMDPDTNGVISITGSSVSGGHAYLINGVNTKTELFRMKNSWGQNWGVDGRAYIAFETMERLIKENGEICLAVEKQNAIPGR